MTLFTAHLEPRVLGVLQAELIRMFYVTVLEPWRRKPFHVQAEATPKPLSYISQILISD